MLKLNEEARNTGYMYGPEAKPERRIYLILKTKKPLYWEDLHKILDQVFPDWCNYSGGAMSRTQRMAMGFYGMQLIEVTCVGAALEISYKSQKIFAEVDCELIGASGDYLHAIDLFNKQAH